MPLMQDRTMRSGPTVPSFGRLGPLFSEL